MDENFAKEANPMKKPFFWLMALFVLMLMLGVWFVAMGVQSSPIASPFTSSM